MKLFKEFRNVPDGKYHGKSSSISSETPVTTRENDHARNHSDEGVDQEPGVAKLMTTGGVGADERVPRLVLVQIQVK